MLLTEAMTTMLPAGASRASKTAAADAYCSQPQMISCIAVGAADAPFKLFCPIEVVNAA